MKNLLFIIIFTICSFKSFAISPRNNGFVELKFSGEEQVCKGILVFGNRVITSASCFLDKVEEHNSVEDVPFDDFHKELVIEVHPLFDGTEETKQFDVAIIKLNKKYKSHEVSAIIFSNIKRYETNESSYLTAFFQIEDIDEAPKNDDNNVQQKDSGGPLIFGGNAKSSTLSIGTIEMLLPNGEVHVKKQYLDTSIPEVKYFLIKNIK